jgi:Co/Zn/Cd efflux system component
VQLLEVILFLVLQNTTHAVAMGLSKSGRIQIMLAIDAVFLILELGVGIVVGSLALLADAFHMVRRKGGQVGGSKC